MNAILETVELNVMNKAETLKKINSLKGRSARLVDDVQECAVSAMTHAAEHGDLSLATKLVNAVSASHATQLRKYLTAFGPITWNKGKGFSKKKRGGQFRVADMLLIGWDTFERETAAKVYDAEKAKGALIRSLDRFAQDAIDNNDDDMTGLLLAIATLI